MPGAGEEEQVLAHCVGDMNWHKDFGKLIGFTKANQYTCSPVSSTL